MKAERPHPVIAEDYFYFVHGYRATGSRRRRPRAHRLRRAVRVGDRARLVRRRAVPPREEPASRPRAARALLRLAPVTRFAAVAPRSSLWLRRTDPHRASSSSSGQPPKIALVPVAADPPPAEPGPQRRARPRHRQAAGGARRAGPPARRGRGRGPSLGADAALEPARGDHDRRAPARLGVAHARAPRPDGRVIWNGTYEETQPPLSEDLGSLPRAWERGFRWVTAEELAEYGLRELVDDLAREVAAWS